MEKRDIRPRCIGAGTRVTVVKLPFTAEQIAQGLRREQEILAARKDQLVKKALRHGFGAVLDRELEEVGMSIEDLIERTKQSALVPDGAKTFQEIKAMLGWGDNKTYKWVREQIDLGVIKKGRAGKKIYYWSPEIIEADPEA